jgi:hypothetical protein
MAADLEEENRWDWFHHLHEVLADEKPTNTKAWARARPNGGARLVFRVEGLCNGGRLRLPPVRLELLSPRM